MSPPISRNVPRMAACVAPPPAPPSCMAGAESVRPVALLTPAAPVTSTRTLPVAVTATSPRTCAVSLCAARSYSSTVPSWKRRCQMSPLETGGPALPYMAPSTNPCSRP